MSHFRSRALLGAVLTTSAIVAVPSVASATSLVPPSATPAGGNLNLELTGGAAASLERQGVTVATKDPAKRDGDVLTVPAATVRFGYQKALTTNTGSVVFSKGSRSVTFSTLSTHLSNRIRIRTAIDGKNTTILTADRKKTRVTFADRSNAELHATKLRLTSAGARAIRDGLKLQRLGRGTLAKAYGKFNVEIAAPQPAPAPQPPAVVNTPGKLEWTQINSFEGTTPPGSATLNRTWLGYFTNSPGMATARGSFLLSNGAAGENVTPTSPRGIGVSYKTTFPMVSSTANAVTKTGIIRYSGLVTYLSPAPPAGHGITISIENPRVEFDGSNTARLYATGLHTVGGVGGGPASIEPYDESQPVFTLDLSGATTEVNADNTTTLKNVAPSVAATNHVFPANYPAGAGPDRTPNTFGSFDITVPNP